MKDHTCTLTSQEVDMTMVEYSTVDKSKEKKIGHAKGRMRVTRAIAGQRKNIGYESQADQRKKADDTCLHDTNLTQISHCNI